MTWHTMWKRTAPRRKIRAFRFVLILFLFVWLRPVATPVAAASDNPQQPSQSEQQSLLAPAVSSEKLPDEARRIRLLFANGRFAEGRAALTAFEKKHHKDKPVLALLHLDAGKAGDTPFEASEHFRKAQELYPHSETAAAATLELARLHYAAGNLTASAAEASRFQEEYKGHKAEPDALLLLAAGDRQSGRYVTAANRYAQIALRFKGTRQAASALVGLADCRFHMEQYAAAEKAYQQALEQGEPTLDIGKIFYQLGTIAKKRGNAGQARRYWMMLREHYPGSRFAKKAEAALDSVEGVGTGAMSDLSLPPLDLPKVVYTVVIGRFERAEQAQSLVDRLRTDGHQVRLLRDTGGGVEVAVGSFTGQADAFIFSEQLEKKLGLKTEIKQLSGGN